MWWGCKSVVIQQYGYILEIITISKNEKIKYKNYDDHDDEINTN